jgi:hypothetical protein
MEKKKMKMKMKRKRESKLRNKETPLKKREKDL